jgi:polyisoprenyl-teichoic acid--peptidoglycan teichoic acid transferase
VAALVALAALVIAAAVVVDRNDEPPARRSSVATTPSVSAEATTTLLIGTDGDGPATWMALFGYDPLQHRGAVVYIPAHTVVEVPGRGLQALGDTLRSGGPRLLLESAENFLAADIDNYAVVSPDEARELLDEMGPLTVDVPEELATASGEKSARVLLGEGPQKLTTRELVDLLFVRGLDGDDIALGARHVAFWDALLNSYRADPGAIRAAVVRARDALSGNASATDYGSVLEALSALPTWDLRLTILPVDEVSAGGAELYAAKPREIARLVADVLPSSSGGRYDTDIQILNGNGAPGVGEDVARRLVGRGFRLVRSGNAAQFDHRRTLIVTYDSSAGGREAAERARRLLGVGQVLVSAQEQGIVDLTIVVGRDFLKEH